MAAVGDRDRSSHRGGVPVNLAVLDRALTARGRNREWLAAQLSVSPATVSGWFREGKRPAGGQFAAIVALLEVTADELLDLTGCGLPRSAPHAPPRPQRHAPREDRSVADPSRSVDGSPTVAQLLRLLEKLEEDVRSAIGVADKNADTARESAQTVGKMSADTHDLVRRFLDSPRQSPVGGGGGDETAAAREGGARAAP